MKVDVLEPVISRESPGPESRSLPFNDTRHVLPDDALTRIETIPLIAEDISAPESVSGIVIYDSWATESMPAMRDIADGHVRVLRLKAGRVTVELVAERRRDDWDFVARVRTAGRVDHSYVLKAGARRLLAGTGGYFHWTSNQVPRRMKLLSYKQNIVFEGVAWR